MAGKAKPRKKIAKKKGIGAGAPPKSERSANAKVAKARWLLKAASARAALRQIQALEATKMEYGKDENGFVPLGMVPDHAARTKASDSILDRVGIGRKQEIAQTSDVGRALLEIFSDLGTKDE